MTVEREITILQKLVADLSDALQDEGVDWSDEGLRSLRQRVANTLPIGVLPDWLWGYRSCAKHDQWLVQSAYREWFCEQCDEEYIIAKDPSHG